MIFPCTGCGACCRKVGVMINKARSEEYEEGTIGRLVQEFPFQYNESGACAMLIDGKCSVYEDRPLICRVEDLGFKLGVNQRDWYKDNIVSCHELMEEEGILDKYRIIWQEEEK
jgi:Fe-S-cluster containining protein